MLILKRRVDGKTVITVPPSSEPTTITATVVDWSPRGVRIGWDAPKQVLIDRKEIAEAKARDGVTKAEKKQ